MKMQSILGTSATLLLAVGFSGQAYAGAHESVGAETQSAVTCADLEFSQDILDVLPQANSACKSVVEIDGELFAEFKAEIVRNRGATTRARFQRADGSWTDVYEFTPDKSRMVRIQGRNYRLRDMDRGQQLNIFLPQDRFEVHVADDDDVTTVPVTIVTVAVVAAPPEEELPSTAGPLPLIGLLGGLFVAMGGGLALIRRRIRS